MRFIRKAGAPSDKSPKRLNVEPAELARKLVKEMDDHVIPGGDQDWVRNRYTVYLCPEDYENLLPRAPQVLADLRAKLAKHVADMEYLVQGELIVELVLDEELELGYFGILAQKGGAKQAAPQAFAEPAPAAAAPGLAEPAPAPAVAARCRCCGRGGRAHRRNRRCLRPPRSCRPSRPRRWASRDASS